MKKYATRKNSKPTSPQGGRGDGQRSKAKVVIISAVLSTLAYFFFMQNTPATKSPAKAAPMNLPKIPEIIQTNELVERPTPLDREKVRASGLRDLVYGVQGIDLHEENGMIKIPFSFRSKKQWCRGGDLDTISLVIPNENSEELLVTLETLTSKQNGDRAIVSLHKLVDGFDRTFQIAIRNKTESLGLFICRDSKGTKSCRGKELKSHKEISNSIADNTTAPEAKKKDYIFYYQNFIVKDGRLYTYKNENTSPEKLKNLSEHLETNYKMKPTDFDASTTYNNVMRSVPAKIIENKIELTLPYNDPRCLPGSKFRR